MIIKMNHIQFAMDKWISNGSKSRTRISSNNPNTGIATDYINKAIVMIN